MNYDFISSYVTKSMLRWKFNIMASVGLLCLTTKMEIQYHGVHQSVKMEIQYHGVCRSGKMEIQYHSVRRPVMFDHKDGNSISWRLSVC